MMSKKTIFVRAGGRYQSIQMAFWPPALPEPMSIRKLARTNVPWNIHRTNEETRRTNEVQSVYRTKQGNLPNQQGLRIPTKRTKQRLWLLLMENMRNDVCQRMARTKNTAKKNTQ